MKDYIEDRWGWDSNPNYNSLRIYVIEAWEALLTDFLKDLLASMPERMAAVIEAQGIHTRF